MKILRVEFDKIGLFTEGFSIDFTAQDHVFDHAYAKNITPKVYSLNSIAILGINASGKSTALRLIDLAMQVVLKHESLNNCKIPFGIIKNGSIMKVDFFHNEKFYQLVSTIGVREALSDETLDNQIKYYFENEVLYMKNKSSVQSKKQTFVYQSSHEFKNRKLEKSEYLQEDDSIVMAVTKNNATSYYNTFITTNFNIYYPMSFANAKLINLFDDSIEKIDYDYKEDKTMQVHFKNSESPVECDTMHPSQQVLSSGTIRGSSLLELVAITIKNGGYLAIDEIENHMHKRLVQTIIGFFNDEEINKKGATLIFSTHYSEVIDTLERKDNVYFLTRNQEYSSEVKRYSDYINRVEPKKSEVFLSNYIKGTAPSYDAIKKVRDYLCQL